ncbi:hypothetical protein WOLCODRAFT_110213 [Wolfiporia cocos MD-104 SS10]|uniref:DUF985 domain-containing protein n=1 Tax=Wolfiporia cocos (strain MD-104) TaxID=742152 RepID=A0A2H3J9B9_WOLCO|nr:hypothetical protein WOLCODRAFT_110213 [Wolfiporia cocos MD-104 SS10]
MSAPDHTSYAIPNSELIKTLGLVRHPEGGYYAETDRQVEQVPSPFAGGAPRPLATSIYYLLTPEEPNGVFHMNKSATMHVLHQGQAEYVLITPGEAGQPPRVEHKIMGSNIQAGELLQLLVPSGVWKMSRLLPCSADAEHTGCLITEVVFPGFAWEDHCFLTRKELERLWGERGGAEELAKFVKDT